MAFSKALSFEKTEVDLANFSKSMSHPARVRIVSILLENQGRISCGEIVEKLPLAQSTVSRHLKELVKAGVLRVRSDGPACFYSLDQTQLLNFCRSFQIAMGNAPQS